MNDQVANAGMGIWIVVVLAVSVLMVVSYWIIFRKAGKPGWASIIPIYNMVVLFQVCGLNPWLVLLFFLVFIPFVGQIVAVVISAILSYRLALRFGKSGVFAVGLFFLPFIFLPILAFGKATYRSVVAPAAPTGTPNNPSANNPVVSSNTTANVPPAPQNSQNPLN